MKRKKRALFKSVVSLILCFAMLLSTTFAWFTDSVTTGINTIAAGTLDVELYHTNAAVTDERVDTTTKLFMDLKGNPILWEPGVVSYENLRIANEGDLALIYQLAINTANENYVLDENDVPKYGLSQILKVGVVEGGITATDRAGVVASVENANWTTLANFFRSGSLLPEGEGEDEKTYGVVIYWEQGENDNYWNLNNGKQLDTGDTLSIDLGINLIATQEVYEEDSFGKDYDNTAQTDTFPVFNATGSVTTTVKTNDQNQTSEQVVMTTGQISASVPAGVQLSSGTTVLTMSVTEKNESDANLTLGEKEAIRSLDVHIEGVDAANTVPMIIDLGEIMPVGLNEGNVKLYHVEGSSTNDMTRVDTLAELDAHNEFYYDPATGRAVVAMATFSEVVVVADMENAWNGEFDYTWYDASKTEFIIANADQLAAFSAIVGGMDGQTKNDFDKKTVKLVSDINLGDAEDENNSNLIFYPIGYHNSTGNYKKVSGGSVTSNVSSFSGTFDGNGHTISNFYQNTWEMFGDYNDGYSGTPNHYKDAMGLFGYVYGGTVKNLTVDNFSSDGEFTPTGVIAAYAAGDATFENIAITNCNPRVYNTGNGGIIGIAGSTGTDDDSDIVLKNITVDNSNKISALWGSWDVACGGLVGMYRGNVDGSGNATGDTISFENCHVAAQIDVYNDVCANYQYYAYRYAGMIIGSIRHNTTNTEGKTIPNMAGISASGCTVNYGDWNDYYYCEFVDNSIASYTHDYQFSRVDKSEIIFDANGNITGCTHDHTKGGYETTDIDGDGVVDSDVLKEDKTAVYLPFHQLFTGYSWGVNSIGLKEYSGIVTDLGITEGEQEKSVVKFEGKVTELANNTELKIGNIFSFVDNGVELVPNALTVTVTNLEENDPVSGEFTRDTETWENGTLQLNGTGKVQITIQDYYFCTPTTITVEVKNAEDIKLTERFAVAFPNKKDLNRVGNKETVALGKLFTAEESIGDNVTITAETVMGATVDTPEIKTTKAAWAGQTIKFSGTGIVKVTISDDNFSTPLTQYLEVVDATNVTGLSGTIDSNVVLLNDCDLTSLTVSGRNTVYGNGFTCTYSGNGQYLNNGLKQGVITVSENGTLDNLRIKASIYPSAYMYYGTNSVGPAVQDGPSSVDGDKTRYHYQLSAVAASGNATITNCYIYGGRNNIFVNTGDVTIKDSILECGTLANVQIQSNSEHTITFENVTTIQHQENATIGDTGKIMLGAGIVVGPETNDNPTIVLNGDFKQYNWVNEDDAKAVSDSTVQSIIKAALENTDYNHNIDGKTASNLGIIYMNTNTATVTNNTGLPYIFSDVSISTAKGRVYSLKNAMTDQVYSDYENADRTTKNGFYQPQFKYSADLGGQYLPNEDGSDEFCYREGDIINVMFPTGNTKKLNLVDLVNIEKYTGQDLSLVVTCKNSKGDTVSLIDNQELELSTDEQYTVTYTVTDKLFYDANGNNVDKTVGYSWSITLNVSLKDASVPDAYFEFDSSEQKMGYYKPTIGDVKQYLPFLAGLKIYDYNGQTDYLRFDGDTDFDKVASVTITGYASNEAYIEVKLTDGGVINTKFLARADSGGGSTYTGSIKTSGNVIYFVNGGGTSNKDATTTAAYWYVDYYKFTGNNGVTVQSAQQTFNSTGSSASTPSGSFSTTIKYTVTYNANGGNCGQTTGYATSVSSAVTLPTPIRSGYIFAGWYTAESGGTRVGGAGESYTPDANTTLYAQWGKPCTVTYDANGGSCDIVSEKYTGNALILPVATRDEYWFVGWYDAASGGNKIGDAGATYNPSGEITLYAHWQEKVEYTITYNANGGTCGTASATYQGTALTLPVPTRIGYTCSGWYTAATGGTEIGEAGGTYTPEENITLYAQWTINSYTITVTTNNATVNVNGTNVNNNDTVSIQYGTPVTVEVGYSKNSNRSTTIKGTDDTTTYTSPFNMPAQNVTINAESSDGCVTPDTFIMLSDGTQKRVDELTFADKLLAWDFFTGSYVEKDIALLVNHGEDSYQVANLEFSDGNVLRIIGDHGIFDYDLNKFVYLTVDNMHEYIGHHFVKYAADGNYDIVTLTNAFETEEYTSAWSITSADSSNAFASGLLTVAPPEDFYNWIEMGGKLIYDVEQFQKDVETYGLYTYDDFKEYVTYEQFVDWNGAYLKVAVEKGYFTFDYILELIELYKGWMPQN